MRAPLGGAGTTHHVYIIERLNNIMMFVLMIYLCVCGLSVLSPTAISLSLRLCLRIKQYYDVRVDDILMCLWAFGPLTHGHLSEFKALSSD